MRFPLFKVHIDGSEAMAQIGRVFDSGFINEGEQVTQLTKELAVELEAENIILVNSCTSALTLALHLAGVGTGDHVVSTAMTCVATNTPIVASGADIVWADVDPENGMVTPLTILEALTPLTKAVVVVAWAGLPPDIRGIADVCKNRGVALILDAAHAFGAAFAGRPIHEFVDYTCYSFQAIKHFTTGDGGALVCSDPDKFRRAKALKWFGLDRDSAKDSHGNWRGQQWDVDIQESGYKFNMNNVAAAIGLSQLQHVDKIIGNHCANAMTYDGLFEHVAAVRHIKRHPDAASTHWVYSMIVDDEHSRLNRDALVAALNREGIQAGLVHVPNDNYTAFERFRSNLPGVRVFSAHQFSLPCGWWLTEDDIFHIANRVKELTK